MKHDKQIESILSLKRKRRKMLAQLPVYEKFDILLQIQKISSSILKTRGIKRKQWKEIDIEQDNSPGVENSAPLILFFNTARKNNLGYIDLKSDVSYNTKNTGNNLLLGGKYR
ncbi:MAG: hypothetical protein ABIE74_00220 [Pseudomonadota bacterium]